MFAYDESGVNIKWKQIITSPRIIRNFSKSQFYLNYMEYADSLASVPFIQDLPAIFIYILYLSLLILARESFVESSKNTCCKPISEVFKILYKIKSRRFYKI